MGQDVCLLRSHVLNPEFGVRFLRSPAFQKQIAELLVGSTFNRINISELKELYVVCPEVSKVSELLEYLDDIDDKASAMHSKLESQIQTLQTLRSTLIAHAVTGKIAIPAATA